MVIKSEFDRYPFELKALIRSLFPKSRSEMLEALQNLPKWQQWKDRLLEKHLLHKNRDGTLDVADKLLRMAATAARTDTDPSEGTIL